MKTINELFRYFLPLGILTSVFTSGMAQNMGYISKNYSPMQENYLRGNDQYHKYELADLNEKILHHAYGNDLRDLVVIAEYANWTEIDAASQEQEKLTEEARKVFFKKWGKYAVTHSDEIYQEYPELTKEP